MFGLIDYSGWEILEESPYGSGRSEKYWIINPRTKEKGIFKFPKVKATGEITGEYWSEKLASEIAKTLNLETAKVEMGEFDGRKGSMSYFFLEEDEILIEAVNFIALEHPDYDFDRLCDIKSMKYYSLEFLEEALSDFPEFNKFLHTIIFDALIGNSDRHHSNWGIVTSVKNKTIEDHRYAPLYDSGSSLCCYIEDLARILLHDKIRFNAQIKSKSKSALRSIDGAKLRHHQLIEIVYDKYYDETIEFVKNISSRLGDDQIAELLNEFDDEIISKDMKSLLYLFICEKREIIKKIYGVS
jgi:hypothetical protein